MLLGCGSRGIQNETAVRQGVLDYLAQRTDLNMKMMQVDVTSVSFRQDEADATVSFRPKGAAGGGMQMRYTLERQGSRWVVKGKGQPGVGQAPHRPRCPPASRPTAPCLVAPCPEQCPAPPPERRTPTFPPAIPPSIRPERSSCMKRVAVLGGGPAGAFAAERLASAGLDTVVIDEKLAWEKPCGGGITCKAYKKYPFLLENDLPKRFVTATTLAASGAGAARLSPPRSAGHLLPPGPEPPPARARRTRRCAD